MSTNRSNEYYPWDEFCKIVAALNISSQKDYKAKRKNDQRLHSTPQHFYIKWDGWERFTGNQARPKSENFYTWKEFCLEVMALGISSQKDYLEKRKNDPRLPSNPNNIYPEWEGFEQFTGKKPNLKPKSFYPWKEFCLVVNKLKITSVKDYLEKRKSDPRLPSSPKNRYPEWDGWKQFTDKKSRSKSEGFYSWEEFCKAVTALGISSQKDYKKNKRMTLACILIRINFTQSGRVGSGLLVTKRPQMQSFFIPGKSFVRLSGR